MVVGGLIICNTILYILVWLICLSSIMVVISRNPVHSVFFLVLVFGLVAGVLFLLQMEFLAIVFIIVYVGAIAVLFLFVIMMLNIRLVELEQLYVRYIPIGALVGGLLFLELGHILKLKENFFYVSKNTLFLWGNELNRLTTIDILGELLYTYYSFEFMLAGVILFIAMVGTIMITLNHQINVKRQEIYQQIGRELHTVFNVK